MIGVGIGITDLAVRGAGGGGGGSQIYPVNTINLDGTSQYLEAQNSSQFNLGTNSISTQGWVSVVGGVMSASLGSKWDSSASTGQTDRWRYSISTASVVAWQALGGVGDNRYSFPVSLTDGVYHVVLFDPVGNPASDIPKCYLNGVEIFGSWLNSNAGDLTNVNRDSSTIFTYGRVKITSGFQYRTDVPAIAGIAIGQELTQADATYLYNGGTPLCWDFVETDNPTLYAKFTETFDLGTFNGHSQTQALTGHKNGWELDNINNAPFEDQGLQVEC